MLTVISPAKKLDMSDAGPWDATRPIFKAEAAELVETAKTLSVDDLQKLMSISANLARLNADRFQNFKITGALPSKPAIFSFAGDTYTGLDAGSLDEDEVAYAQDHLGILSGLYGLLRPLDAIQPYRLEMGSRLRTKRGKSLYEFWGDTISNALNEQAEATRSTVLVNCASQEYFSAVDLDALELDVVTPVFLEDKPGGPKIVSFCAKKARGAMARFVVQNRLRDPDDLLAFDLAGYAHQPHLSQPGRPVFLRADTSTQALRNAS
ncbi:peroxide stress protein YaaA [Litoreibacter roseus]|uniref:UPF0246 protein KIN_18270 n=1 Tax=Litoreibacter roseus TaxID=2601869 RepID=A0A6N6JEH3_9RHOB|nr:peroxide stress protein YaaA [Litoreibacter roseus]GFE64753.1 UPF0246 protein [Litoreibacter roseus]